MASRKDDQVQKDHFYCIIDEVDSILIDEARTPLIIFGPMQEDNPLPFKQVKPLVQSIVRKQQELCNELALGVKKRLEDETLADEQRAELMLIYIRLNSGCLKISSCCV